MKLFRSITIAVCCFSSQVYGQGGFFWTQYSSGNPAATGVNSNLDISSVTSIYGKSVIRERINADVHIKKLHGAIGVGYRYTQNRNYFQSNNPYLNYSFHIKTGENSLLAFGTSVDFAEFKYSDGSSTVYRGTQATYGIGAHYQFKGLKVGIAASMHDDAYGSHFGFSDAYIDYTHKLSENWAVNAAIHGGSYPNYGAAIMARAIYKNKFWFGLQAGEGNGGGVMLGMNLNEKWSLGYSISASKHMYSLNSSNSGNYSISNQSLMLRFQLPGK